MAQEFVQIGDVNIRRSNVKSFGVSSEILTDPNLPALRRLIDMVPIPAITTSIKEKLSLERTVKYLYVTTFQNDNYKFYEQNIDLDAALKALQGR